MLDPSGVRSTDLTKAILPTVGYWCLTVAHNFICGARSTDSAINDLRAKNGAQTNFRFAVSITADLHCIHPQPKHHSSFRIERTTKRDIIQLHENSQKSGESFAYERCSFLLFLGIEIPIRQQIAPRTVLGRIFSNSCGLVILFSLYTAPCASVWCQRSYALFSENWKKFPQLAIGNGRAYSVVSLIRRAAKP